MVDAITFLVSITWILLAGIIGVTLSKWTKIPSELLLFLSGVILGSVFYSGRPIVQLGGDFLSSFSVLALIIIIFDVTSRLKFSDFDHSMYDSLWFFAVALVINMFAMSYLVKTFFGLPTFSAVIFALLISCIEFSVIFSRHHHPRNKLTQLLRDESNLSCALVLIVPFLMITFLLNVNLDLPGSIFSLVMPFIINIFAGIGAGLIVAIILFKLFHSFNFERFSSLLLATGVLAAYLFSLKVDGNGLVAVATLGLVYGNIFSKHKDVVKSHLDVAHSVLDVFVFVLAGVVVGLPLTPVFLRLSFGLFIVYLIIRVIAAEITLRNHSFMERFEMALFVPKGLATVAIAFALLNFSFFGVVLMVRLLLAFFVYSLIFDYILDRAKFYAHR